MARARVKRAALSARFPNAKTIRLSRIPFDREYLAGKPGHRPTRAASEASCGPTLAAAIRSKSMPLQRAGWPLRHRTHPRIHQRAEPVTWRSCTLECASRNFEEHLCRQDRYRRLWRPRFRPRRKQEAGYMRLMENRHDDAASARRQHAPAGHGDRTIDLLRPRALARTPRCGKPSSPS